MPSSLTFCLIKILFKWLSQVSEMLVHGAWFRISPARAFLEFKWFSRSHCVTAELTGSGKWGLRGAPQQCPEASGLLPECRGVVLWGCGGRKRDKNRSLWTGDTFSWCWKTTFYPAPAGRAATDRCTGTALQSPPLQPPPPPTHTHTHTHTLM